MAQEDEQRETFRWTYIDPKRREESPSPRQLHTGWEYAGNLWTFGGAGPSPKGYLNDNGDFENEGHTRNNQLLCYLPNINKWTNPRCYGDVPSPRTGPASTAMNNKAWLFGGCDRRGYFDDMYELSMLSLTWTLIQETGHHFPREKYKCTLTALTDDLLVLHGGDEDLWVEDDDSNDGNENDTWIMNLKSYSWTEYKSRKDHPRILHTGTPGLNNDLVIFGGLRNEEGENYEVYNNIFHVVLEPKCLQQLAMKVIHKYRGELPWQLLPTKLISKLGTSLKEKRC